MAINYITEDDRIFFRNENYLYRIISVDRLIDFKQNKFTFVSPSKWSDPYEKAFLEAKYKFGNNEFFHPLKHQAYNGHRLFAQCWTTGKQTEAMWKMFATKENGVTLKISTTRMLEILNHIDTLQEYDIYLGKVNYQNTNQLYDMKSRQDIWEDIKNGVINNKTLGLLYKKRMAFDYEKEYRVLMVNKEDKHRYGIKHFTIDNLLNYFEYLKFDPRMDKKLFNLLREMFIKDNPDLNIHKSLLYDDPISYLLFNGSLPREINDEYVFK
jgi:hypothetical protein